MKELGLLSLGHNYCILFNFWGGGELIQSLKLFQAEHLKLESCVGLLSYLQSSFYLGGSFFRTFYILWTPSFLRLFLQFDGHFRSSKIFHFHCTKGYYTGKRSKRRRGELKMLMPVSENLLSDWSILCGCFH